MADTNAAAVRRNGTRPGHRWRAAAVLFCMVPFHALPTAAQQAEPEPSPGPLPTILYPSQRHATAPPDSGPPAMAPQPVPIVDENWPIEYVLVGGVWGYWDRDHHFHPKRPANGTAIRGADPRGATRAQSVARAGVTLQKASTRGIVVHSSPSRHRGPMR